MKNICIDVTGCRALGDTLCVTPVVRKISNLYGKKISVISHQPDVFINSPYVENNFVYSPDLFDKIKDEYEMLSTFNTSYNENGVCYKHNTMDIRQFHAVNLGFMLTRKEMYLDYFSDPISSDLIIPEKYVLIHPVQNWNSRTWSESNWRVLVKFLNEKGLSVISIGKDSSELGGSNIDKPVFNIPIKLGYNLVNKTNLSDTWHLINNSLCFVTMDSGLLHLAGTTDCEILQLGSSINPEFRSPYRNNSQEYKYHYVLGSCSLHCASDMKYGINEWGTIHGIPSLVNCLEKKSKFECHPNPVSVYNKILEII